MPPVEPSPAPLNKPSVNTFNDKGEMVSSAPTPAAPPKSPNDPNSPLKQIRTFQGDVAEALHKQQESLVSIQRKQQVLEETKKVFSGGSVKAPAPAVQNESNKKLWLFLIGSVVLLALGSLVGWYAYGIYREKTALPPIEETPNRFITTVETRGVDTSILTREEFISAIRTQIDKGVKEGGIAQIELHRRAASTTQVVTTKDLLNKLESRASGTLIRAFDPAFMLGLLGEKPLTPEDGGAVHTFILIKLDSFDNAFPGMLGWEAYMREDLLPLFVDDATIASTSASAPFIDVTIQNKDARILMSQSGRTVLLYSFFDNNMLIITDNEQSLKTLVNRLNAEKLSR